MSFINEILCQQVRQLLRIQKRSCGSRPKSFAIPKRRRSCCRYLRNLRFPGGQDRHRTSSDTTLTPINSNPNCDFRPTRPAALPVGNSCIVPLLHIWLRLNTITPTSSPTSRQRYMHRFRLQQRPLLHNLRQVASQRLKYLYRRLFPRPAIAGVASQTEWRDQAFMGTIRKTWLRRLMDSFHLISKNLETALSHVGPSPNYKNTSAAMELLDISDMADRMNSVVIDYLVNDDDYITNSCISLTQLF